MRLQHLYSNSRTNCTYFEIDLSHHRHATMNHSLVIFAKNTVRWSNRSVILKDPWRNRIGVWNSIPGRLQPNRNRLVSSLKRLPSSDKNYMVRIRICYTSELITISTKGPRQW